MVIKTISVSFAVIFALGGAGCISAQDWERIRLRNGGSPPAHYEFPPSRREEPPASDPVRASWMKLPDFTRGTMLPNKAIVY